MAGERPATRAGPLAGGAIGGRPPRLARGSLAATPLREGRLRLALPRPESESHAALVRHEGLRKPGQGPPVLRPTRPGTEELTACDTGGRQQRGAEAASLLGRARRRVTSGLRAEGTLPATRAEDRSAFSLAEEELCRAIGAGSLASRSTGLPEGATPGAERRIVAGDDGLSLAVVDTVRLSARGKSGSLPRFVVTG